MRVINQTIEKYVHWLWIPVGFLGIAGILIVAQYPLSFTVLAIFLIGLIYLGAAFGLITKKSWGWRITVIGTVLNILLLIFYPNLQGFLINLLVFYCAYRFRGKLGGHDNDPLFPKLR